MGCEASGALPEAYAAVPDMWKACKVGDGEFRVEAHIHSAADCNRVAWLKPWTVLLPYSINVVTSHRRQMLWAPSQ